MTDQDFNEMKCDIKAIKEEIVKLRIAQAVTNTKQKSFATIFGLIGGIVASIVTAFIKGGIK